ncbi:lytic murein transglycosylase B [Wenzhouxiangella sp. XN79A]|uniref:lytic murein transglycosylase B n=1 Tax=Wenzhouxiangella sp. XN79A TaxID=2724193 RepID=UPI00144AA848|nr:lytic murein transglycosylase B [Wenzhouxiangella sp. XN79A]NKI33960.1 lytic murein transglycosylase B [Wenzhouxiangella sp. XN79A]
MHKLSLFLFTAVFTLATSAGPASAEPHPGADAFVERVVAEYDLDPAHVRAVLERAEYQQAIIDAITRPAESKPWYQYRPIFLGRTRIDAGAAYWTEHRELIDRVATEFGVPAPFVLAIIGVETNYGTITGSYRVVDALATLGFYYPRRGAFFARELGQYFQLAAEEGLPLEEVRGSYAGAMGLGQFIPSSYRAYAVDFDGTGSRDLWQSLPDALGSVANYLKVHGWRPDQPSVLPIRALPAGLDREFPIKPETTLDDLAELGIEFDARGLPGDTDATLIELQGENGPEHWIGLFNFYVITRYNRSPLYAMAVSQLAAEIARTAGVESGPSLAALGE